MFFISEVKYCGYDSKDNQNQVWAKKTVAAVKWKVF